MTCRDSRCDGVFELALELAVRYDTHVNDTNYFSASISIAEFRIVIILTEIDFTCWL